MAVRRAAKAKKAKARTRSAARKGTTRKAAAAKAGSARRRTTAKPKKARSSSAKRVAKTRATQDRRQSPKQQQAYIAEIKALVKSRGSAMKAFAVGDTVVEPSVGVCRIEGIRRQRIDDKIEDYYIFNSGTAKVYVPLSQIQRRGVRRPMTRQQIRKIYSQLRVPVAINRHDARMQYLTYREVMRSGDPVKITRLLRELFTLDKMDELKGKEKEIMEQAKKFLVEEIAFIQDHPRAKVQEDIEESLGAMYRRKVTKDREARAKRNPNSN
jgi:CarD family transcriptional regulator